MWSSSDDIVDSRDVFETLAELQKEIDHWRLYVEEEAKQWWLDTSYAEYIETTTDSPQATFDEWAEAHEGEYTAEISDEDVATNLQQRGEFDLDKYVALKSACEEMNTYNCDAERYGETLIAHRYFVEYTQDLASDLGYINDEQANTWPFNCIDWREAAEQLKPDYTEIDIEGWTFWMRMT